MEKTYIGWQEADYVSKQKEYTESTPLLDADGTVLCAGYARHNVFEYNRDLVKPKLHRKEWDFYQISDGNYMIQLSFANITLGGYVSLAVVDLKAGKTLHNEMAPFVGQSSKYALPPKGDVPNKVAFKIGKADFEFVTTETKRTLRYETPTSMCRFEADMLPNHENITTVLPFEGHPDMYFMTTKQMCMPAEGIVKWTDKGSKDAPGEKHELKFTRETTFASLDWGRVCTPYKLVWYWGSGSTYLYDKDGGKHTFGFEITWGIGDERNATETMMFYDGKGHKFEAVDVETFPKPDRYMEPWKFISRDGRFNLTMTPFYDHHSDLNVLVMRMHSHQVHGLFNGTVVLDDGTVLEIKDMYAFCEYVENRW